VVAVAPRSVPVGALSASAAGALVPDGDASVSSSPEQAATSTITAATTAADRVKIRPAGS
jgi:hypothetical protein